MTAKLAYEACLIELNKQEAPSILLEDFNYLFNKAINLYINRKYNIYDVNQQSSDDLRVLKATSILTPTKAYTDEDVYMKELCGATYEVNLPDDYLHMLNCICIYKVHGGNYKCYNDEEYVRFGANRLTADMWGQVINNFYMKPSYKKPYYYINNVNTNTNTPTNPIVLNDDGSIKTGTDYDVDATPVEDDDDPIITPVVTTYTILYGTGTLLSNLKNSNVSSKNITGSCLISTVLGLSAYFVFVKIPTECSLKVSAIYNGGTDEDDMITVKTLSELSATDYETDGYTTYIGYIQSGSGMINLGTSGESIYIKIN